jgi:argininosuccinate lyase
MRGVPFREAHETVAGLVARLEAQGRTLADADPSDLDSPPIGPLPSGVLDVREAVERRRTQGGPSTASVKEQLVELRGRLAELARAG